MLNLEVQLRSSIQKKSKKTTGIQDDTASYEIGVLDFIVRVL